MIRLRAPVGLRHGPLPGLLQHGNQLLDLRVRKHTVRAFGAEACVGRLIQPASVHRAGFGQILNDRLNELDLVCRMRLVIQETGQSLLGGGAIQADQAANEQAQAFALSLGFLDLRGRVCHHPVPIRGAGFTAIGVQNLHAELRATEPQTGSAFDSDGIIITQQATQGIEVEKRDRPLVESDPAGIAPGPKVPIDAFAYQAGHTTQFTL